MSRLDKISRPRGLGQYRSGFQSKRTKGRDTLASVFAGSKPYVLARLPKQSLGRIQKWVNQMWSECTGEYLKQDGTFLGGKNIPFTITPDGKNVYIRTKGWNNPWRPFPLPALHCPWLEPRLGISSRNYYEALAQPPFGSRNTRYRGMRIG